MSAESWQIAQTTAAHFTVLDALKSGQRVKVHNTRTDEVRTGIVVTTTHRWWPRLRLIHRGDASVTPDTITANDRVIGWWDGTKYGDRPDPKARSKHV